MTKTRKSTRWRRSDAHRKRRVLQGDPHVREWQALAGAGQRNDAGRGAGVVLGPRDQQQHGNVRSGEAPHGSLRSLV